MLTLLRSLKILASPAGLAVLQRQVTREREHRALVAQLPGVKWHPDAQAPGWRRGVLRLERGCQVEAGTMLCLGDDFNGYGEMRVGPDTWIGPLNNFRLASGTRVVLGRACLVSQFCTFVAANHQIPRDREIRSLPSGGAVRDIEVGDDVWFGAGTVVLPGARIASGAVIGANSVVSGEIPSYEIWAGAPARKIGERR